MCYPTLSAKLLVGEEGEVDDNDARQLVAMPWVFSDFVIGSSRWYSTGFRHAPASHPQQSTDVLKPALAVSRRPPESAGSVLFKYDGVPPDEWLTEKDGSLLLDPKVQQLGSPNGARVRGLFTSKECLQP